MRTLCVPCLAIFLIFGLLSAAQAQNCTLPLQGGTLNANQTVICPTNALRLWVTGGASGYGNGVSYQWESSPDNNTWTPMDAFTEDIYTLQKTAVAWYRRKTTCPVGGSVYSTSLRITHGNFNDCYCTPSKSSCATYHITRVVFGSINNSSTCGTNGYTNFGTTLAPADVAQGGYLPISISLSAADPGSIVHCYIDYNQDGTFNSEEHTLLQSPTSGTFNGYIKVPFSARTGTTRMRIIYNWGSSAYYNACFTDSYSETEDYAIRITPNTTNATGHVIYVKASATGNQTGRTWTDAKTSVREALAVATAGDTVKVAAGTYYSKAWQTNGIVLKDSVLVLGGYPATGNPTNAVRNPSTHPTILSGYHSNTSTYANADYHVFFASGLKASTIDGFIVQDGGNHYGSGNQSMGGGIYIENSTNITVKNCVFRNNYEYTEGSAISVSNASVHFDNCIVTKNNGYYSNIWIQKNSQARFTNLLAAHNSGGTLVKTDSSALTFNNSTLAQNSSTQGLITAFRQSQVGVANSILYFNSFYDPTWQRTNFDSADLKLEASTANVQSSLLQIGHKDNSLLQGRMPKFKDTSSVAGLDGLYFTADDGFSLVNPCSPAMNAGSNAEAVGIATDITGKPRIYGQAVDLGAYEVQQAPTAVPQVLYVNPAATGANNGSSWQDAYTDLHKALQACSDTIKLAAGVYQPWKTGSASPYWIESKRVIMGAYPATGNPTDADRNYTTHLTKIDGTMPSGDLAVTVLRGLNLDSTSVIDGLIFTNTGRRVWTNEAAVVYAESDNPVISNCGFTGNYRRVFWGHNNKNPLFLNCRLYENNGLGNSYGLDYIVVTNSQSTTFRNCTFENNLLVTNTGISGEFGRVLVLESTNAVLDSCRFVRNRGTALAMYNSHAVVTHTSFLNNYSDEWTVDLYNRQSNPVFRQCTFTDSLATAHHGGIMNNYQSNPEFTDCRFTNGRASRYGGVAYNDSSNARFRNCVFVNSVNAFYNTNGSNMELTNCISTGSSYNYSAPAFMYNFRSSPILNNCVVVNGSAGSVGVMVNDGGSRPRIYNSIFWKNFSKETADPLELSNRVEIKNIGSALPTVQHSMFELYDAGAAGNNQKSVDPRFRDFSNPIGLDSTWFTADDGLQLCDCSEALNSGDNTVATQAGDIIGKPRIVSNTVDRGAYERQTPPATVSKTAYVNAAAAGLANGASWTNAYPNLQQALQNPCADTIKIAAGVYKPALQYRDSGYYINRNLVLLGSYDPATEARNVEEHPSILSGDIGIVSDTSDNSFGLIKAHYVDSLVIDGLVFRDVNLTVSYLQYFQHALMVQYSQYLSLTNSRFYDNYTNTYGGALYLEQVKKMDIRKNVFSGNKAVTGAGIYFNFYTGNGATVTDCVFSKNEASFQGGGVWIGQSGAAFINCLFTGNRARRGAGMLVDNNPDVLVRNCTFADNMGIDGGYQGMGIYSEGYAWKGGGPGPYISNCLFTGNSGSGEQTVYQDLYYPKYGYSPSNFSVEMRIHHSAVSTNPVYYYGGGLINPNSIVYKNRANPIGPDGRWFTQDDGLQLSLCSNGLDKGFNAAATVPTDMANNPRIFNATVDLGAYEFNGQPAWAQLLNTSDDTLTANKEITDTLGWTHYYQDCQYLMSIQKAGQNIGTVGDGSFELKVVTGPGYNSGTAMNLTSAAYNASGQPWHVMNRYWKVKATSPVADSIRVRFPYTNADYQDVIGSNPSVSEHTQLAFFKVSDTNNPFDLAVPAANFFRYNHAEVPSTATWTYLKQDSIHLADYFVKSFSGGGGGAWYNASLPDLTIRDVALGSTSVGSGETVTASFIEANTGQTAAGAHKVYFYLSADNILTTGTGGDLLLGTHDISSLNGSTNTGTLSKLLTVPCSTTTGNYTLFIVSDGLNAVAETNEYNNVTSVHLTITVSQAVSLTPSITATGGGMICNGNPITLTATTPGCATCTYTWSNGQTGNSITVTAAGMYTVTATTNCKTASASYTVALNPVSTFTATASKPSVCTGNSVVLTATGATTYAWSGNGLSATYGTSVTATPSTSGAVTYTVTGTTNGCSVTRTIPVTVLPTPTLNISSANSTVCKGSSVELTVSGASTYSWSPAAELSGTSGAVVTATPTATTTYTVTGVLNGCSSTQTKTITVMPTVTPAVSFSISGCPGNNPTLTATAVNGGTNPLYQWYVNDTLQGTGSTYVMNAVTNGTKVYVQMSSNAACAQPETVTSATTTVNCMITAIPTVEGVTTFTIGPNPSTGLITVSMKLQKTKNLGFNVTDGRGKTVYERKAMRVYGTYSTTIDLRGATPGVYYLRTIMNGESFVEKMVIVR